MESKRENFNATIYASYVGYISQAIVNNLAPLLFLTFQAQYGLSLSQLSALISVSFCTQLLVDLISTKLIARIGYRCGVVAAHICCGLGLISMAVLPDLIPGSYPGLVMAVVVYAIGGGLIEVLISPIVEACPTERKEAAMSLLHSFYCWGSVGVVLLSTLFFSLAGTGNWRVLAVLWSLVPLVNAFVFTRVPIRTMEEESGGGMSLRKLAATPMFWLMLLLMICSGASEQAVSQWASAFAEAGLKVGKTIGDLAGPCAFSLLMGLSRALYAKFSARIPLTGAMIGSGILCIVSYLLAALSANPVWALVGCAMTGFSVGIMWPGTFSLAAAHIRNGGTAMFALLALGGDLGCASGPTLVGAVASIFGDDLKKGILCAIAFPVLLVLCVAAGLRGKEKKR